MKLVEANSHDLYENDIFSWDHLAHAIQKTIVTYSLAFKLAVALMIM